MKAALTFAGLRALRTIIQGFAGVAVSVPAVSSAADAKTAGIVAAWASLGVVISGIACFLQNLGEQLEAAEEAQK